MGTQAPSARQGFIQAISAPEDQVNPVLAAVYVAAEEYPDLDVVDCLGSIAVLGERVRRRLRGRHSLYDAIHRINEVLFEEEGFAGNTDNYHDPRNCYMSDVLDRRLGVPVPLCLLYAEVARQAGRRFRSIGMTGHFVLAAGRGASEIFVDPFNRGGLLSRKECLRLATRGRGLPAGAPASHARRLLPTSPPRSTLRRLLINLKRIYLKQRDYPRALASADRVRLLSPGDWRNLGDLARIHTELGQFSKAVDSLTAYLRRAPEGANISQAENALRQLRGMTGSDPGSPEPE